ncbi:MAG: DUF2461 domain-containing protein [Planctomycetota bacterium]|nr:DUF2461 domain-containing protein [Planctomycetota bacterium]
MAAHAKASPFPGYSRKGMTWWRGIAKNNNRDWFMAQKPVYEAEVKTATEALAAGVAAKVAAFAPAYAPADPKKAVMRIYRDVRFSKDKSPYKTELGAKFGHTLPSGQAGGPSDCAGFWFSVGAKGVDVVGGAYAPGGPQLKSLRAWLDENHAALGKLLGRKPLRDAMGELQGEQLVRVPRGYDAEHVAADLLRRKQLYLQAHLPAKLLTTPDLQKEIVKRFKLMLPFVEALNEALGR